jgi:acetylornithine deacetylase
MVAGMSQDLTPAALEILERLIAFDTTSRGSNLELIQWVEAYLDRHGVPHRRVPNAEGTKSNLLATVGPGLEGGVVLSGHTDVVPVDGQAWSSDPFTLTPRDGRLYGRGTCDMKGFLALALAAVPELAHGQAQRPVHLAFSYDEEIGCLGAPSLIEMIGRELPRPALVVVGEPTDMVAVNGHKGIATFTVTVRGREAHSSQTQLGVSAIMEAVPLLASLKRLAERLEREADAASPFTPKGATLTIGVIHGGTAGNILARECQFLFDLRCPPGLEPMEVLAPVYAEVEALDRALKARAPEAGVAIVRRSMTPPLSPEPDGAAEAFARRLAGDNGPPRAVAFAAEAGQFQQAGFSTVMCGPGSIEQAHQPDEFVERAQMERGAGFMRRLIEWAANPAS